jgi:protein involved in polysaccharide export with SLBB domain
MTLFSRIAFAGGLLVSALLFGGCATTDDTTFFPTGEATNAAPAQLARFQVGDTVTITLSGGPVGEDPAPITESVKDDGTITMPDIGKVQAVGQTAGQLQDAIHDAYVPKYRPHLTVTVTTGDRVYYVTGEVHQPNRELYVGETTVTRAITSAGDFTDFANRKSVWLIRGKHRIKVNCDDILDHPEKDPLVFPGDQIVGPRRLY